MEKILEISENKDKFMVNLENSGEELKPLVEETMMQNGKIKGVRKILK